MSEKLRPATYIIGKNEFERTGLKLVSGFFRKPTDYHFPDPPIRKTFVGVMIQSFRVSRARSGIQLEYCEYLRINTGWDYITSISNFLKAGGCSALSPFERKHIMAAANKVRHHSGNDRINLENIEDQFAQMSDPELLKDLNPVIEGRPLFNMPTREFLGLLRAQILKSEVAIAHLRTQED